MAACPSLEICNRPPHRVSRVWKTEQCVRVVRHQKEDPAIPRRGLLPVAHGVEDRLRVPREKIRPARLRAERNKKRRLFGGNPDRSFVRELFSTDVHAATKIPQATRLADRKVGHPGGAPLPGFHAGAPSKIGGDGSLRFATVDHPGPNIRLVPFARGAIALVLPQPSVDVIWRRCRAESRAPRRCAPTGFSRFPPPRLRVSAGALRFLPSVSFWCDLLSAPPSSLRDCQCWQAMLLRSIVVNSYFPL